MRCAWQEKHVLFDLHVACIKGVWSPDASPSHCRVRSTGELLVFRGRKDMPNAAHTTHRERSGSMRWDGCCMRTGTAGCMVEMATTTSLSSTSLSCPRRLFLCSSPPAVVFSPHPRPSRPSGSFAPTFPGFSPACSSLLTGYSRLGSNIPCLPHTSSLSSHAHHHAHTDNRRRHNPHCPPLFPCPALSSAYPTCSQFLILPCPRHLCRSRRSHHRTSHRKPAQSLPRRPAPPCVLSPFFLGETWS